MHRLLKPSGSLVVHCDWHASHYIKVALDGIFGYERFVNEIVWCYKSGGASPKRRFSRKHDALLWYAKGPDHYFAAPREKSYNRGRKPYRFAGVEEFEDENGWYTVVGMKDWWEMDMVGRTSHERTGYSTQKAAASAGARGGGMLPARRYGGRFLLWERDSGCCGIASGALLDRLRRIRRGGAAHTGTPERETLMKKLSGNSVAWRCACDSDTDGIIRRIARTKRSASFRFCSNLATSPGRWQPGKGSVRHFASRPGRLPG